MMQGHIWELYGDVFAQSSTPNVLHFRQLPSRYRKIEEKTWRVALDIHVRDFTMDPAQDLLVLIEEPASLPNTGNVTTRSIRVHLRSLITGDRHRLAPQPAILVHDLDAQNVRVAYTLQVCDNLLGILLTHPELDADPEITIWDWTTGQVILACFSSEIATFAFLSSRFLLVGSVFDPEAINIQARLYVFDMTQPSSEKFGLEANYFCAFLWPEFDSWTNPLTFSIRSDPSPAWQPNPEARPPFSTAPGDRLFIMTVSLENNGRIASYDMFVSANTLLSHIGALSTEVHSHEIKWDEWGPTGTRLMQSLSQPSPWVCYVFGTKFVSLVERTHTSPQTLEMRDFNQLAMKRDAKVQGGISHHVHDTTVIRKVFANEIHTSLPYRVVKCTLPPCSSPEPFFAAAMCSEDSLILVDSSYRHLRILTF